MSAHGDSSSVAADQAQQSYKERSKTRKTKIFENLRSFFVALFLVLLVRSVLIEPFKIPSGSMIPTLMVGDYIFVNKLAYGLKVPFSDWITDRPSYLIPGAGPKHGEVIVFKYPRDESIHYIKRVIAVPGDQVRVENKQVFVNGKPLNRRSLEAAPVTKELTSEYHPERLSLFEEIAEGPGFTYRTLIDSQGEHFTDLEEVTVPEEHLFVMGDNRDFSADSRAWGFVPFKNIRGKAMFVWFSLWLDFEKDLYLFHPRRIGTLIH
ncbi:MAG: signal peptidase I [Bdellovibrionota bacterium]